MKGEGGQGCFITSALKLQKKQKYTTSSDGKGRMCL